MNNWTQFAPKRGIINSKRLNYLVETKRVESTQIIILIFVLLVSTSKKLLKIALKLPKITIRHYSSYKKAFNSKL